MLTLIAQGSSIFGEITKPPGVETYDSAAGGIGIIYFFSVLLQVATVVAGLWAMAQFFLAGYDYITANGDSGAHNRVRDRITMSVVGLVIIVASYAIAGLIGYILFGDATFILNPRILTPTGVAS